MGEQHPAEYVKHLVDRLHTAGALRLLDLEPSYQVPEHEPQTGATGLGRGVAEPVAT